MIQGSQLQVEQHQCEEYKNERITEQGYYITTVSDPWMRSIIEGLMQRGSRMERWPSGSAAAASEVTTVSTAASVPSTFHAGTSTTTTQTTTATTTQKLT